MCRFNDLSQALKAFCAVTGRTAVWTERESVIPYGGHEGDRGIVCSVCLKNGLRGDCRLCRGPSGDLYRCERGRCFVILRPDDESIQGCMVTGPVDPSDSGSLKALCDVCLAFLEEIFREGLLPRKNRLFDELTAYILEHISEAIDTDTLSSRFFVSGCTLSRLTLSQAGMPLRKYITSLRLCEARALLISSDFSVREIAEKVGITDYNYFSRIYRKRYLCPPSETRKIFRVATGVK